MIESEVKKPVKKRGKQLRTKFVSTREPVVPKIACYYCDIALAPSRLKEHPGVCDKCYLSEVVPLM